MKKAKPSFTKKDKTRMPKLMEIAPTAISSGNFPLNKIITNQVLKTRKKSEIIEGPITQLKNNLVLIRPSTRHLVKNQANSII
jgi:hypothetical protein